jgi:hypothetical protein
MITDAADVLDYVKEPFTQQKYEHADNVSSNGDQKRTWILNVTRSLAICNVRV